MKAVSWFASAIVLAIAAYPSSASEALPNEAQVLAEMLERDIAAIKKKADDDIRTATEKCHAQLQQLQDTFSKAGQLDEAVAVRDRLRLLKSGGVLALPDPGDLSKYYDKVGQVFYFEVIGATDKNIYGSDIYTYDSPLATAAVHAGAIKYAEKGVVKVTIMPGKSGFEGTERNGVTSRTWTTSPATYKVEAVNPKATGKQAAK